MQNRILILFAHPVFEKSRIHRQLVRNLPDNVTFRDLYELYPEFNIDVAAEKQLLLDHDIIIWQHPIYWYSCPAVLKQWIDLVLEAGWAYGPGGTALAGKSVFQALSTGGAESTYTPEGFHKFTLQEFLVPFKRTAELCNMAYLPPFAVHGSHRMSRTEIGNAASEYMAFLKYLASNSIDIEELKKHKYMNDWYNQTIKS